MFHSTKYLLTALALAAPATSVAASATGDFLIERSSDGGIDASSYIPSRSLLRRLPSLVANEKAFKATATDETGRKDYSFLYRMDGKPVILVKTNPATQKISIKSLGATKKMEKGGVLQSALCSLRHSLLAHETVDALGEVESLDTQFFRATGHLCEWPSTLDIDFDFDKDTELARFASRPTPVLKAKDDTTPDIPGETIDGEPTRRRTSSTELDLNQEGDMGNDHPARRRLASLCPDVGNYWFPVTHDDWRYSRGDDATSYYAWLSHPNLGSCSESGGGTWFWKNNQWRCYEPDHDRNVEYAYGDCFGRCGAGCGEGLFGNGDSMQYTRDCADHDSCVRFGHSQASFWCDDEFLSTTDDILWAPNCF